MFITITNRDLYPFFIQWPVIHCNFTCLFIEYQSIVTNFINFTFKPVHNSGNLCVCTDAVKLDFWQCNTFTFFCWIIRVHKVNLLGSNLGFISNHYFTVSEHVTESLESVALCSFFLRIYKNPHLRRFMSWKCDILW